VGWVCCWFSPCSEGFSPGTPVFLPPEKPTFPNSNSIRIEDPHENQLVLMWLPL
jgi:hypothetical protein